MKRFLISILALLSTNFLSAQLGLKLIIRSENEQKPLPGTTVVVKGLDLMAVADSTGFLIINNIPNGRYTLIFSHAGFNELEKAFTFPLNSNAIIAIELEPAEIDLEVVTVISTRSNRSINHTPTRVEVIGADEIREEAAMRPGDIRMLLGESTGIQVQPTSATNANASIRIQGLDGRYTQILKDGFPVYAGAASGLGLLQTPPLDLRQVEIIKGAASTLYGGGAIAGLVNLISKIPAEKRELGFYGNVTSAGGLDINSFYSKRNKKAGVTLFVARNSNKAFDPANISFSAIPEFERYTINPKLFLYFNDKTKFNFSVNTSFETRLGGDMEYIKGRGDSTHSYFERSKTKRISTQLSLTHQFNEQNSFSFKNSVGYFNRIIGSKGYDFDGTQYSSFTEATWVKNGKVTDWVTGMNILTDHFTEKQLTAVMPRDYTQNTIGVFVQNTWNTSDWLTIETGLRADHVTGYGFALLPRVSALFKINSSLSSRIGGGFGYKPPTIFTEESEKLLYRNVLPVDAAVNKLERSYGANWDMNYHTTFNKLTFSINQFFFYTYLKNPLFLEPGAGGLFALVNSKTPVETKGAETNIKLGYGEIALYLGYTYTDANLPLTPKHRLNAALVYEIENKWKIGSELYYFSSQKLGDGTTGRNYWLSGLVAERLWKKFSLYINFENFGDVRQTKFESIYTGTVTNPVFKDIYAPLEGFVVNGGIKIRL